LKVANRYLFMIWNEGETNLKSVKTFFSKIFENFESWCEIRRIE